ncbi:hypothetical protein [Marinibacterium profundimaris]|uniref:Uncharacterized protein n=1 Tax=Marinibacterium profundimaris TaxID=1679460 RepID=A0A225NAB0_9RHOB|nr:hypothetical protein [Marinibacterium profundimaris]OWU66632.1 hypothetical protein ATO3_27645 [Marinibacterium profundimaris]
MRAGIAALALFALLWGFARVAPGLGAWAFGLAGVVIALPLALVGAHGAAARRQRMLQVLDRDSWARRWLSGPVLRLALALLVALVLALLLLVRLIGQGVAEWAAVAVTALAVPLGAALWDRLAGGQIAPEFRVHARVTAGRIFGALLALGLYLLLRGAPAAMPPGPFTSALVEQAVLIGTQWRLLEEFALGQLSVLGDWGRLAAGAIAVLGNLALVWTAAGLVAAFLLPPEARQRALAPVGTDRPGPAALGWAAAVATVILLFLYTPLLAAGESLLRSLPRADRPSEIFVTQVEEIGGQFFEPGTIAALTGHRIAAQAEAAPDAAATLHRQIDTGYDAMAANIDPFLDWYYSLPAEYAQIAHLLAGDFEGYLAGKVSEHLLQGDPFAGLTAELARLETLDTALQPDLSRQLTAMAASRQVTLDPGQPVAVTGRAEAPVILGLDGVGLADRIAEGLQTRLAVAGGSAGLAGALTGAVVAKLGAKGVTKAAAKAAIKVAASKGVGGSAGAGAGAAAGGLVGSVVPGIGTVAGAVIGGVVGGLAVGVGTDFLLVKLEETLSRDTLRAEMVAALDESRAEMLGLIDKASFGK